MADKSREALSIERRKQVQARTGLGRSSIYDGVRAGTFPAPVRIGARSVGWLAHEVDAWAELMAASEQEHAAVFGPDAVEGDPYTDDTGIEG